MKLLRILFENVRGLPDGNHSFVHPSSRAPIDSVFITGPGASGKTAFLEAIAALKESVGAYGLPPAPARLLRHGAKTGRLEGTWLLTADEVQRSESEESTITTALGLAPDAVVPLAAPSVRDLFASYGRDPARGKFEYFPANRRLAPRAGQKPEPPDTEARLRLVRDPNKYGSIKQWLIHLAIGDGVSAIEEATKRGILLRNDRRDSLAPYKQDIALLLPKLRLVGVEMDGDRPELRFERVDGSRLFLDDLSDSEQQAILFSVTFRRIGLSRSVVLIDQPELYIHADNQLQFAQLVAGLGHDNQIFFATGSAEITRVATPHQIVRLGPGRA